MSNLDPYDPYTGESRGHSWGFTFVLWGLFWFGLICLGLVIWVSG